MNVEYTPLYRSRDLVCPILFFVFCSRRGMIIHRIALSFFPDRSRVRYTNRCLSSHHPQGKEKNPVHLYPVICTISSQEQWLERLRRILIPLVQIVACVNRCLVFDRV